MTEGTIIGHVEQLYMKDEITLHQCKILAKGREGEIAQAQEALRNFKGDKLAPIFGKLKGKVSYETIRLARVLMS